ncbi:MAG: hypothetical protein IMF11_15820 [Proteobacteria bacterium]|nr:hypothetical protein [Pseudomonadota bacterium]
MLDPEYLRLYRRYVKALRAYENMLKKRREARARWRERQKQPAVPRRPVGAPPRSAKRHTSAVKAGPGYKPQEMRVYMGKILGWARMVGVSPPLPDESDPTAGYNVDERLQLKMYWNAKIRYEKCKKEFFDYARRGPKSRGGRRPTRGYRKNLARARGHNVYAADLQLLGADETSEAALENARREVETACYELWDNYRDNPNDKQVIKDLIQDGLVEAQLHGIDDSPIVKVIQDEIDHLVTSGKLK